MARPGSRHGWRRGVAPVALGAALMLAAGTLSSPVTAAAADDAPTVMHLVTFEGAGTAGYRGPLTDAGYRSVLTGQQDAALTVAGVAAPVYRWTTALSGVAVELTPEQAEALRNAPRVQAVEENAVRTLAATSAPAAAPVETTGGRGGQGVVVGVVDTGIWPDTPLFADSPGLGSTPRTGPAGFSGRCQSGEDWSPGVCNDKLVGASWFVAGFGDDRLAADEPLSPRDVRGHGTQVASIAAGNADVSVTTPGLRGSFGGVAPRARLAVYKACWSAPDPRDDGCSTADLVAAIDRATRDGVDVLNLSVGGGSGIDTVERALLGAAEAGVVVVAAAGNDGDDYASHASPWVTTVGGLTTTDHSGTVAFGGQTLSGTMTARRPVTARIVLGRAIPAPASTLRDATMCTPGSLDASAATDRIVVCERGALGRIEKSTAVQRAGGVGMVLVDTGPGSPEHDLHAVPTVHLAKPAGDRLTRWAARHPRTRVTLRPDGPDGSDSPDGTSTRVAPWSSNGDPAGSFVKPDLVAPATGVLAGTAPAHAGSRWTFASGTTAATAWTSGAAAVLLARHDWSAPVVRSALATSAGPTGGTLQAGAGALRLDAAQRTRLAYSVGAGDYRTWLRGDRDDVNTPSLLVRGESTSRRRLTNVGDSTGTWQVSVTGFESYDVEVSPATLTLRPGRAASYRVTVSGGSLVGGLDQGRVVWTGADGVEVQIPVAVSR
ncbi:MAG: S8 family serine peptidase [Nocardioides sp.]